jgi:hypothetical protein
MRFYAEQDEGIDHVIFAIDGKWNGSYVISMERVAKL